MKKKLEKIDKKEQEKNWEETAQIFEKKEGLSVMRESRVLSPAERRELLGASKTKLISVRIPEEDISALKTIAEENDRKYQQLVVHAIERFLEDYWQTGKKIKKSGHQ